MALSLDSFVSPPSAGIEGDEPSSLPFFKIFLIVMVGILTFFAFQCHRMYVQIAYVHNAYRVIKQQVLDVLVTKDRVQFEELLTTLQKADAQLTKGGFSYAMWRLQIEDQRVQCFLEPKPRSPCQFIVWYRLGKKTRP